VSNRLMIFIDGSNVYHSLRDTYGRTDVDYSKLVTWLAGGRELRRTYYYNAQVDQAKDPLGYQNQQRFISSLRLIPYFEIRMGRLVYGNYPQAPPIEKGIDVRLATDMLTHAYKGNFDIALLVSGDNDFADMLQAVKDHGKHVEVALFGTGGSSAQLRQTADRIVTIDAAWMANCWR